MWRFFYWEDSDKFRSKYRIQSNRHPEWNYSDNWYYFITIWTKNKIYYFGEIVEWKMVLNDAGVIVENEILQTSKIRKNVTIDEYIVMPNHVHMIVIIDNSNDNGITVETHCNASLHKNLNASLHKWNKFWPQFNNIWTIVRWFKWTCTKQINKKHKSHSFNFAWQPNYHDRIIRNEKELNTIRKYIKDNLRKWNS